MRHGRLEVYRGRDKQWHWRVRAGNHKIVAVGGEGYKRRAGCVKGIRALVRVLFNLNA